MRIQPNHTRLRVVAIICWFISGWWLIQIEQFERTVHTSLFLIAAILASTILLAIGIAFWQLGTDKRAGVLLDNKGIMLNLGHYAAFVAWDNLDSLGVSQHRTSLLSLGSAHQLGIKLRDPERYLQSYEQRLPASRGPLGTALRCLHRLLGPLQRTPIISPDDELLRNRARTGYDILIPEALLGQRVEAFITLADGYRRPVRRKYTMQLRMLDAA